MAQPKKMEGEDVQVEVLDLPMLLAVHAWANEVQMWETLKRSERELEDLVLLGKGKTRNEEEEVVEAEEPCSDEMTFFAENFFSFFEGTYGLTREAAQQVCTKMITAGVFISISTAGDDAIKYQFTSAFQRFVIVPEKTEPPSKPSRLKPADSLERLVCIFREPPADVSEREAETRNFILEGLHCFFPTQIHESVQVRLVSGLITITSVINQLAPKGSAPSDSTGSPISRLGNANIVLEPLTTPDRVEQTVHLAFGAPEGCAEHHTRSLAKQMKNTMAFLHGPPNDLVLRLSEHLLKQEISRTGLELQKVVNPIAISLPVVRYTQSQTSILAYRLGGKCTQSTLGTYARAHRLVSKIMRSPHVMGAAVLTDTKVVVHEMTEDILRMVQLVADTSKARDGGWLNIPPNQDTPYHAQGSSHVLFDAVRYGYSTKKAETQTRAAAVETCSFITVFLTNEQVEELKTATVGAHLPRTEELPSKDDLLLPTFIKKEYETGRFYGLYLQHLDNVTTAVLLPIEVFHTSCCVEKEFKSMVTNMMVALMSQSSEASDVSDGSFALYNKTDESLVTSRPNDTHFANECAFAHYFMNNMGDGEVNRFIVSRGPSQHHFTSRSFAGIQTFYQSPTLTGSNRKMSVAEEKAKDHLGAYPCLL